MARALISHLPALQVVLLIDHAAILNILCMHPLPELRLLGVARNCNLN